MNVKREGKRKYTIVSPKTDETYFAVKSKCGRTWSLSQDEDGEFPIIEPFSTKIFREVNAIMFLILAFESGLGLNSQLVRNGVENTPVDQSAADW